jgi:hypothetical protein
MMDRIRRDRSAEPDRTTGGASSVAAGTHEGDRVRDERAGDDERFSRTGGIDRDTMNAARARQREEYGGIHWGAAFFGFLAAAGLGAILTSLVSAAGATLSLGSDGEVSGGAAETIGIAGGIALLLVLAISYFAGGYVAGRMSRFDGARQGLGVFLVALVLAIVLAVAGAILGSEFNVLAQLNLPRIPIDEGSLATGGLIALAIGLIVSVLAAIAGGKAGERYHKKIDRLAVDR